MTSVALPSHCLSVPGCTRQRLTYAGYCAEHSPSAVAPRISGRCNAPLRCYCPTCSPDLRHALGPQHGPESIRLMLAARKPATPTPAPVVLEVIR